MMLHFTILKSSNSFQSFIFVFLILSLPQIGQAQIKNDRDRKIVRDVLKTYGRECGQREAIDGDFMKRLEVEVKESNRAGNPATQKCFENHYSQISGVFYLYQKICKDIYSNPGDLPDEIATDQLLEVYRYRQGIRPFQAALNDCLSAVADKKGMLFMIPLADAELDFKTLLWEIETIRVKDPFANTFPVPAR